MFIDLKLGKVQSLLLPLRQNESLVNIYKWVSLETQHPPQSEMCVRTALAACSMHLGPLECLIMGTEMKWAEKNDTD